MWLFRFWLNRGTKSIQSFDELKHSTAYMLRVNIDWKKSMGQFQHAKPENKGITHNNPTK